MNITTQERSFDTDRARIVQEIGIAAGRVEALGLMRHGSSVVVIEGSTEGYAEVFDAMIARGRVFSVLLEVAPDVA